MQTETAARLALEEENRRLLAQLDLARAQLSPREECNLSSDVSDAEQIVHSPHRAAALQTQARVRQHMLTSNL